MSRSMDSDFTKVKQGKFGLFFMSKLDSIINYIPNEGGLYAQGFLHHTLPSVFYGEIIEQYNEFIPLALI